MKTIEQIKDLMVGKSVITDLADLLRVNDEEFVESEKKYVAAVDTLRANLPKGFTPTLDEYLNAWEADSSNKALILFFLLVKTSFPFLKSTIDLFPQSC